MRRSRLDRFVDRLSFDDSGCWLWIGPVKPGDYGRISLSDQEGKRRVQAHRWFYEELVGPIPEGYTIDHLCRQRICVNPDHLEPVTRAENILRGNSLSALNARKTECPYGHMYDETNTYINPRGSRMCRRCAADKMQRQRKGT